nr:MAG TPA: hypothetical protein [Caudoviricetes sp.]
MRKFGKAEAIGKDRRREKAGGAAQRRDICSAFRGRTVFLLRKDAVSQNECGHLEGRICACEQGGDRC